MAALGGAVVRYVANRAIRSMSARTRGSVAGALANGYKAVKTVKTIMPYAGAAAGAYEAFKGGSKRKLVQTTLPVKKSRSVMTQASGGSGKVAGRRYVTRGYGGHRFAKKHRRPKKDPYREKGFVHTAEVHGTISDPDCIYVGHSAFSGYQILEVVCQTLLKKLFSKTNFICKDIKQQLPSFSDGNVSNMWRLRLVRVNRDTGAFDNGTDYVTGPNYSIYDLVGDKAAGIAPVWPYFVTQMQAYMTSEYSNPTLNILEPVRLELYREEGNASIFYQPEAWLDFTFEQIHIFGHSELKVQNRTLAADNSNDSNDISNNPIIGYEYNFTSGSPRCKDLNASVLSSVVEPAGVITARAAAISSDFKEPPSPKVWWNCSSFAKVKLDPGQIKKSVVHHRAKMPLLKFLKVCNFSLGTNNKQFSLFGKSAMLALEDMINVNATNPIAIAYEIDRKFGCYLTTHFKNSSLGVRYDMTVNNNAP